MAGGRCFSFGNKIASCSTNPFRTDNSSIAVVLCRTDRWRERKRDRERGRERERQRERQRERESERQRGRKREREREMD